MSACNVVNSSSEAADSEQILRNLDVLIGHWSSWEHNGESQEYSRRSKQWRDCISCIISLLLDANPTAQVSAKALCFLQTLANDAKLLDWLCRDYQLCSALAVFLQSSTVTDNQHLLKQVIQLMKALCYRRKSSFTESSLSHLLKVLFRHTEESTSDLALPCLELLNYLSWSPDVSTFIGRMPNFGHICKVLLRKMGVQNTSVVIHALSALANLPLEQSLAAKIFGNSTNMKQVLHLVLSIMTSESPEARDVAVDLFHDLLSSPDKRSQLLRQRKILVPCIQKILERPAQPGSAMHRTVSRFLAALSTDAELFSQILFPASNGCPLQEALIQTALTGISLDDASLQPVHWAAVFFTAFFKLLSERGQLASRKDLAASVLKKMTSVFPKCTEMSPDELQLATEIHLSCLRLVLVLWESGECGRESVTSSLSSADLHVLLKPYLRVDPLEVTACETDSILEVVLGTCTLLVDLDSDTSLLRETFQEPSIAGFLSLGLSSTNEKLMRQAFHLLCASSKAKCLQGDKFLQFLGAVNSRRQLQSWGSSDRLSQMASQQLQGPPAKHSRRFSVESSIEEIAHRLADGVDMGELKNSEVLAVYEGRILALKSKEEKLQQLLSTQSTMLQESDRLINQHLCSQAHWEAEMDKMQAVVRQYERRLEAAQDDHAKLTKEIQHKDDQLKECRRCIRNLENQVKQMEETNDALQEKANRLEVVQKNLDTAQKENAALSEMIAMLQRHSEALKQKQEALSRDIESLEGEKKTLHKGLKEKEAKVKEQAKCMHVLQTKLDEKTAQVKALAAEKNSLQETNSALQKDKSRLEQEVSSLEASCRKAEASLQEKGSRVQKLTTDLEKFRQMQAMIRNISANNIL